MTTRPRALSLLLPDPDATDAVARRMAARLAPGDCVLLAGPIGAGKSHLARAAIRALTHPDQEVPSPTYTLMQGYETAAGPLWHLDLYRLAEPEELAELGLDEVVEGAISLIEWPERLGPLLPARHLSVVLAQEGHGRRMDVTATGPGWDDMMREIAG